MTRLMESWNRYWFRPAPLLDLGVVRIIAVGTQLLLLLFFHNLDEHRVYASLPDHIYKPIPMLRLFIEPLGGHYRPSFEVLKAVWVVTVGAGLFALVGLRTNLFLGLLTAGSVFLQAHAFSYGDIHNPPAIMMMALGVLTVSPAGGALSVDALLRRSRSRGSPLPFERTSVFAVWPLLLVSWLFVLMYFSAGSSKVIYTHFGWGNGYSLQYFLLADGLRLHIPLAVWIAHFHELVALGSWIVMLFELTFALCVVSRTLRWIYVPIGIGFHLGNYVILGAPFWEWIALYSVFIPWSTVFVPRTRLVERGLERERDAWLVYDGACPFCRDYVRYLRIRATLGVLHLVDAREGGPLVSEIHDAGLDLNDGMVLKLGDRFYHGADSVHALALMSSPSSWFNRINLVVFRSKRLARLLYPVLRSGRNATLALLGRDTLANHPQRP